MKRLIIIGNGYDLAHNLKTSLSDFRDFMLETDSVFVSKIDEVLGHDSVWNKLEESLSILEAENFREINYTYLKDSASDEWRDSSNHDYQYQIDVNSKFITQLSKYLKCWIKSVNINVEE